MCNIRMQLFHLEGVSLLSILPTLILVEVKLGLCTNRSMDLVDQGLFGSECKVLHSWRAESQCNVGKFRQQNSNDEDKQQAMHVF